MLVVTELQEPLGQPDRQAPLVPPDLLVTRDRQAAQAQLEPRGQPDRREQLEPQEL